MRATVEAVVFDLDGTLLDRRRSFERFVRDQRERFLNDLQTADREQYVQTLIELDGDGYAPRKSLFTGMTARFGIPSGVADTLLDDYRAGFPSACVLFPDAAQTLWCLRASGLKLGLITNGSIRMQSRKLECLALAPMFDTILIPMPRASPNRIPESFTVLWSDSTSVPHGQSLSATIPKSMWLGRGLRGCKPSGAGLFFPS